MVLHNLCQQLDAADLQLNKDKITLEIKKAVCQIKTTD